MYSIDEVLAPVVLYVRLRTQAREVYVLTHDDSTLASASDVAWHTSHLLQLPFGAVCSTSAGVGAAFGSHGVRERVRRKVGVKR